MLTGRVCLMSAVLAAVAVFSHASGRGFLQQPEDIAVDSQDEGSQRQASSVNDDTDADEIENAGFHGKQNGDKNEDYVAAPMKPPVQSSDQEQNQEQEVIMENKKVHSSSSADEEGDVEQSSSQDPSDDSSADSQEKHINAPMKTDMETTQDQDVIMENRAPASEDGNVDPASLQDESQDEQSSNSPDEYIDAPMKSTSRTSLMQSKDKATHEADMKHTRNRKVANAHKSNLKHGDVEDDDSDEAAEDVEESADEDAAKDDSDETAEDVEESEDEDAANANDDDQISEEVSDTEDMDVGQRDALEVQRKASHLNDEQLAEIEESEMEETEEANLS